MVHPPDRGDAGPSAPSPLRRMRPARGAVSLLLPLLLPLVGCERKVLDAVPTMGVQPCKVQVGEQRTNVLLRCGPGCGSGETPAGRCDIYHNVLICYGADARVASLRRLAPFKDEFKWCKW